MDALPNGIRNVVQVKAMTEGGLNVSHNLCRREICLEVAEHEYQ
jgi:hypothetical protein